MKLIHPGRPKALLFYVSILSSCFVQAQSHPDAIYPIPPNPAYTLLHKDINLFTGDVNNTFDLIGITGNNVSFNLTALYNSRSAALNNANPNGYQNNALGGNGWKLMDYPKIAKDASGIYMLDGYAVYPLTQTGTNTYTPGGKYYLWQVSLINNSSWDIATAEGIHYLFNTRSVPLPNANVWNMTTIKDAVWGDSLSFNYSGTGNLNSVNNTSGDTLLLNYNGILQSVTHRKNGNLIANIGLSYQQVNGHPNLSAIKHYHQVYGQHADQMAGGYNFTYWPNTGNNYANAMATFTDQAGAVTTYSYIPNAGGNSYRTVQLAVNDGYSNNSGDTTDLNTYTAIVYDTTNVITDLSGIYHYYNIVNTYPGIRYGMPYNYGSITYGFLNGLPAQSLKQLPGGYSIGSVHSPALQGCQYLYLVNSDTSNITTTLHYWSGNTFPQLDKFYNQLHGVGKWVSYTYGTPYNLIVQVATSRRTPEPLSPAVNTDSVTTSIQYAFQQYPALAAPNIHLISATAGEIESVQEDLQGAFKITACKCTQWTQWNQQGLPGSSGNWGPWKRVSMRDSLATAEDCPTITASSSQWIVNTTYNSRNQAGFATDSSDATGDRDAAIYAVSPNAGRLVAQFTNASVTNQEAAYTGFESYENSSGWNPDQGTVTNAYSHTGRSCYMPGAGGYPLNRFRPVRQNQVYRYGFWYRLDTLSAYMQYQYFDSLNNRYETKAYPLLPTNGKWTWFSCVMDFPAEQILHPNVIFQVDTYIYTNDPQSNLAVDDVSFMPVNSSFDASVYETHRGFTTASLGMNGQATFYVRDRYNKTIAEIGPGSGDQISQVTIPYNSREGSLHTTGKDTFDPIYPNMSLNLNAHKGGTWDPFANPNSKVFPASGMVNMQIINNWLTTTGSPASATFSGNINQENIALYMEIFPDSLTANSETGFAFQLDSLAAGKDSIISTSTLKFVLTQGLAKLYHGNMICKTQPLMHVPHYNTMMVTISNGNFLIAYLNGRYVFEYYFPNGRIEAPAQLIATNAHVNFDNFLFLNDVQATQQTFDALMRPRQQLIRRSVNELQVKEILYGGPLNLPVVETRAGIIGGRNADSLGLSYKPNFASGFNYDSMTLSKTSVLGAAAGYENPFSSSVAYSKDPLMQITGIGSGGNFTAGKKDDHYLQLTYGNAQGNIFNYTPNDLISITRVSSDSTTTITYLNKEEVPFAEARIKGNDTLKTQYEYDRNMRLVATYQPNYYNSSLAGNSNFIRTQAYDYTGNKISETSSDAGTSQYIYDLSGRLRFRIDAAGMAANPDTIIYTKYDQQNRVIEEGFLQQNWNRSALQAIADTSNSYPAGRNYSWRKRYTYDTYTGDSICQGKLTGVAVNWNADAIPDIYETYWYDRYGQVTSKGLKVLDFDTTTRIVQYTYDQQGRTTGVQFPGTGYPGLVYTYDGTGNLTSIGIPGDTSYYATYDYGYATTERLNKGTFMRSYNYTENGWINSINDQLFNEKVTYAYKNTKDGPQYYDGKIQALSDYYKSTNQAIQASYSYDNNGRLAVANLGANNPWSMGIKTPLSYDNNGNILSLQTGTTNALQFQYQAGTNKVNTVQGFNQNYTYNGNGSITAAPYGVNSIQYDPLSGLTLSMKNRSGNTLSFEYDGKDQRVLKTVQYGNDSTQQRLYVHGLNDYPLYEVTKTTTTPPVNTFYIYGPKGMVAMQQGTKRYFVIRDYLNSTRLLIDTNNVTKATFNYNSYGTISYSSVDTALVKMPVDYLYTGQEYDAESGLYNYRARLYDPGSGRFYSTDPAQQYPSPYVYAGNNPISYTDPTGAWSFWGVVTAVAVAVVVVAVVAIIVVAAPVAAGAAALTATSAAVLKVAVVAGLAAGSVLYVSNAANLPSSPVISTSNNTNSTTPVAPPPVAPPIDATGDGITAPVNVTQKDFGVTSRPIAGRYSIVNLTKATPFVPDNSSNSTVNCPTGGAPPYAVFPYRPIIAASGQTPVNAPWTDLYDHTLYINSNFFDISDGLNPYVASCTNILGVSVSNNNAISNWQTYPAWSSGGLSYYLDAMVIYKDGAPAANGKKAEMVRYKDLTPDFITQNVAYAVGGMYYIRNGEDTSKVFGDIVSRTSPKGRTAVGIDDSGTHLLVLEVDSKLQGTSEGVTFADMVKFFTSRGYNNVINLDGDGSSAFYYKKNATTISSLPMDTYNGSLRLHRPIPNFLGFK